MNKARHYTEGGNTTIVFPPGGQIGPATKDLLDLHQFRCTGEFSNRYRKGYWNEEQQEQADRAAKHIAGCYNTGKKEYCRELLHNTRTRIRHG